MKNSFSDRLNSAISITDISVRDLASRVGLTESSLRRAILGQSSYKTMEKLPLLADYLNLSILWLLTGQEAPSKEEVISCIQTIEKPNRTPQKPH